MAITTKGRPQLLDVNRIPGQPKKRKKIALVFDEDKRRDFLKGFHKRKLERKQKAKEDLDKQLKEERKRIKNDAKERYKKLLSSRDVPELSEFLSKEEYETKGHTISILELNVADLVKEREWIGENKPSGSEDDGENDTPTSNDEEIQGMSLRKQTDAAPDQNIKNTAKVDSTKGLNRVVKKATLKQIKKSKAFQQKQRLECQRNKKQKRKNDKCNITSKKRKGRFKRNKNH